MEPEHYRFGGGALATSLHAPVVAALALAVILILWLPRKYCIIPLLLGILLIPKGQVIVLAGLHFFVYRIVVLAGLARWGAMRHKSKLAGGFSSIDWLFTLWALFEFAIFSLQWMESQALIKALGDLLDAMGGYFVFRFLIVDKSDVRRTVQVFAIIAIILGATMINEQRTGTNVFGLVGGVGLHPETRDGAIRSQGSFQHSILAGSFGATLLPLLVWLWSDGKARKLVVFGMIGATVMTVTPHSSTTVGTYVAGIVGLCFWPLRKRMRVIRWGIVVSLIGLHLIMNGPVWSIFEHVNLTGSSESFHRYQLIDTFIRHFGDWWLLGTRDNGSWGWEMRDTSNQYVTWGITGGLITFILFIALISVAFGKLGRARKAVQGKRAEEWFVWCFGASLFAHVVVYFGIDYFDEMQFVWYALLAMISVVALQARRPPSFKVHETDYKSADALSSESLAAVQ